MALFHFFWNLDYVQTHAFFYHDGDIHMYIPSGHTIYKSCEVFATFLLLLVVTAHPRSKVGCIRVTSEPSATVIDLKNAGTTAEVYSFFHTDPRAMQANLALLEICLVVVLFG